MKRSRQNGGITRHRGWWVLRYREQVGVGGILRTLRRAKRLAPVDAQHKTKASVRHLAEQLLQPLNWGHVSPLGITTIEDFVERVYLPFAKQQKRPSTYRGYSQIWNEYLKRRCGQEWMRDVKTHHVQAWLNDVAHERRVSDGREYTLTKSTIGHIKFFLSGVFRHAAQQGYFDQANPVKLAEIPGFSPRGKEGHAYSFEEIDEMERRLPQPAATVVATAAYTGLRLGELQGLTWEDYTPPREGDELGMVEVRRSVWRGIVGEPKTEKSKSPVPVVPYLAEKLADFRESVGNPDRGPIFANGVGKPSDLNALYYRQMRRVIKAAGLKWRGWHGFRRGLASNLNRIGVDDSVIQVILRHSDISVTQRCYIKTTRPDTIAAMRRLSGKVSEIQARRNHPASCASDEPGEEASRLQ